MYLRRIIEHLIEDAHSEAAQDEKWDETNYEKSRFGEQVVLLKRFLPSFLVENPGIHSILSKGIHTLSEDECLHYFEPVYGAIRLVLDQKIEEKKRVKEEESALRALQDAQGELSRDKGRQS